MSSGFAERAGPDSDAALLSEHRSRYRWAASLTSPCRVLDVACGSGIGFSYFPCASLIVGIDRDLEALSLAADLSKSTSNPVTLAIADATALPFPARTFDLILSFETIEHLQQDDTFIRGRAAYCYPTVPC